MADTDGSLHAVVGPFYDGEGVAELRGTGGSAVESRRLVALTLADGSTVFPVWQFDSTGTVNLELVSMWQMLADAASDGWTAAVWMCCPSPDLNDLSPVKWATAGNDLAHVEAIGVERARRWLH